MPIVTYTPGSSVVQQCAKCSTTRELQLADLQRGHGDNPNAIALPPCSCSAREFLLVPLDVLPASHHGSAFDLHRRVVGAIGEELAAAGRVHPDHRNAPCVPPPDTYTSDHARAFLGKPAPFPAAEPSAEKPVPPRSGKGRKNRG